MVRERRFFQMEYRKNYFRGYKNGRFIFRDNGNGKTFEVTFKMDKMHPVPLGESTAYDVYMRLIKPGLGYQASIFGCYLLKNI